MPIYEYECTKCGHLFEIIQKFSDRPKTRCPKCRGSLRKLVSAPAIQFKGSGWYVTDYARKGSGGEAGKGSGAAGPADKAAPKAEEKGKSKPSGGAGSGGGKGSGEKGA